MPPELQVSLLNPDPLTLDLPIGLATADVDGHPTLRSVVDAGGFDGLTVGIGVRPRLPFRVPTLTGPDRIVLDVSHRWT